MQENNVKVEVKTRRVEAKTGRVEVKTGWGALSARYGENPLKVAPCRHRPGNLGRAVGATLGAGAVAHPRRTKNIDINHGRENINDGRAASSGDAAIHFLITTCLLSATVRFDL